MSTRVAAIAGVYEYPGRLTPGLSPMQLQARCAAAALADAGLTARDVDALYSALDGGLTSRLALAEYLGVHPHVVDTTMVGGASFEFHLAHARNAILAGKSDVALITYGATNRSAEVQLGTGAPPQYGSDNAAENMEAPWGTTLVANYALVAARHFHDYGTTPEQLAEISVVTRSHALRNPQAVEAMRVLGFRDIREITVDDVVSSPMIADPLHKLDCCMVSDGAGAVVVVSAAVAQSIAHRPVWVLGTGEAVGYVENDSDICRTAASESGPIAFGEAGVSPGEVDVAMIY